MIAANDFTRQWADVGGDVISAVERVGESGRYILGSEVQQFEEEFASYWGLRHAVGVASGMDAIEIGLRILGCGPGDRVLTTPLSAFATTLAIVKLGAVPVFVDTDEQGLIDMSRCYDLLRLRQDIRFFVPVHLYGHALDAGGLAWLREQFDLNMVEDCAQSVGAHWRESPTGSVGQIAATSFYPTKNLGAMGDGGALLTNDVSLDAKARVMRCYGETERYQHVEIGYNSRLDELQAAVLRTASLPRLQQWVVRRQAIADAYDAGIRNRAVRLPGAPEGSRSSWHLYPVHVEPAMRGHFLAHLESAGIAAGVHYPRAIPDQPALEPGTFELIDNCETARRLCVSEVSLPIHPYLTNVEIARVIQAVNAWTRTDVRTAA
ncbi:MAG: DegT/DnrJ/EryC1/StrS family aminotransferase, partial [Acidobacteriota bacterium]